ncbi:MAG TPA: serine hydrolase, partial [Usitatibacter sp.]|nr:serine hydrolase [Usitatibacter sp.]
MIASTTAVLPRLLGLLLAACALLTAHAAEMLTPPPIAARAFIAVDLLSGQTLAAGAESDRFEPGSLTKLMTAYIVFAAIHEDRLHMDTMVPVAERAVKAGGARMFVAPGTPVAVGDLLRGMIVQSANDATLVLAGA